MTGKPLGAQRRTRCSGQLIGAPPKTSGHGLRIPKELTGQVRIEGVDDPAGELAQGHAAREVLQAFAILGPHLVIKAEEPGGK